MDYNGTSILAKCLHVPVLFMMRGSGLAERPLLRDSSGTAAAVIEPWRLTATEDAEDATNRGLVGADQTAIAQIGFLAAL